MTSSRRRRRSPAPVARCVSSYHLTRRAEADLLDIFLFGLEQFGLAQAERYKLGLERGFTLLADNPKLGRTADAVAPGLRRHEHESHVILYEQAPDGVLIVALIRGRSIRRLKICRVTGLHPRCRSASLWLE